MMAWISVSPQTTILITTFFIFNPIAPRFSKFRCNFVFFSIRALHCMLPSRLRPTAKLSIRVPNKSKCLRWLHHSTCIIECVCGVCRLRQFFFIIIRFLSRPFHMRLEKFSHILRNYNGWMREKSVALYCRWRQRHKIHPIANWIVVANCAKKWKSSTIQRAQTA